jgi:hypothetical protein
MDIEHDSVRPLDAMLRPEWELFQVLGANLLLQQLHGEVAE